MREIKRLFDPYNLLNPGKIVPAENGTPTFKIDQNWRMGAGYHLELPFRSELRFRARDESFIANLEQCNGCGACLKSEPTMCPTFIATSDEIMSTRGRANTIRAVLEGFEKNIPWHQSPSLELAITNCLSCKACTTECPSNVNMSLLKADLLHARQEINGLTLREYMVSHVDVMGYLACLFPRLANGLLKLSLVRRLMSKRLGFTEHRPFPTFALERFDVWFRKHQKTNKQNYRGEVYLWDDTFVRYFEPDVGKAAVKVLETIGFRVRNIKNRKCCGRPAFSVGQLDRAKSLAKYNIELIRKQNITAPIIFLEPSCYSMFIEDYLELGVDHAEEVANQCILFEEFLLKLLKTEPDILQIKPETLSYVAIHAHCHVKALRNPKTSMQLLEMLIPGKISYLDTGCCGMAGQFGQLKEKYELSIKVAKPLVEKIQGLPPNAAVLANGISCRHQISHLTSARPIHIAELLAKWI